MSQLTVGARGIPAGRRRTAAGSRARVGATSARAGVRVVDASRPRVSGPGFAVLMVVLLFAGLMASLTLNSLRSEGSFTLAELQREQILLAEIETGLRADVAEAKSADALTSNAVRLGMVPSPSTAFVRLSDGAVLGVAAPGEESAEATVDEVTRSVLDLGRDTAG